MSPVQVWTCTYVLVCDFRRGPAADGACGCRMVRCVIRQRNAIQEVGAPLPSDKVVASLPVPRQTRSTAYVHREPSRDALEEHRLIPAYAWLRRFRRACRRQLRPVLR